MSPHNKSRRHVYPCSPVKHVAKVTKQGEFKQHNNHRVADGCATRCLCAYHRSRTWSTRAHLRPSTCDSLSTCQSHASVHPLFQSTRDDRLPQSLCYYHLEPSVRARSTCPPRSMPSCRPGQRVPRALIVRRQSVVSHQVFVY